VAQLVAALITVHGLLSFHPDVYGLFDPSGKITQLNSTQLTTPKEKSGLQEERSYKSLYKSPILQ